jgi:hypothetical protein
MGFAGYAASNQRIVLAESTPKACVPTLLRAHTRNQIEATAREDYYRCPDRRARR